MEISMSRLFLSSCFIAALSLSACNVSSDGASKTSSEDAETQDFANEEERVADQMVTEMRIIVQAIESVKGEDSAQAAAETIAASAQKMRIIGEKAADELDRDKFQAAMGAREDDLNQLADRAQSSVTKLAIFKSKLAIQLAEELAEIDWSFMAGPEPEAGQ